MISTKTVKLTKINDYSAQLIEAELKNMGFDVLRWAITDISDKEIILNIAVVED